MWYGKRAKEIAISRAEYHQPILGVDTGRTPYATAAAILSSRRQAVVVQNGITVRIEHGIDLKVPPLLAGPGIDGVEGAAIALLAVGGRPHVNEPAEDGGRGKDSQTVVLI